MSTKPQASYELDEPVGPYSSDWAITEHVDGEERIYVNRKHYRSGVYPASNDLSGALAQVLDQRYHLTQEPLALRGNLRQWDLESDSLACFMVAGPPLPAVEEHGQKESRSLIRENSKDVIIMTFHEVLKRRFQLRDFLCDAGDVEEQDGDA